MYVISRASTYAFGEPGVLGARVDFRMDFYLCELRCRLGSGARFTRLLVLASMLLQIPSPVIETGRWATPAVEVDGLSKRWCATRAGIAVSDPVTCGSRISRPE